MNIWLFSPGCGLNSSTSEIAYNIKSHLINSGHTVKWVGLGSSFDCNVTDTIVSKYIEDVDKCINSNWAKSPTNLFISREETSSSFPFWTKDFQNCKTFKRRLELIYERIEPNMKIGDCVILNDMILRWNIFFVIAIFRLIKKYRCKIINYIHTDFLYNLDRIEFLIKCTDSNLTSKEIKQIIDDTYKPLFHDYDFSWITTSQFLADKVRKLEERFEITPKHMEVIPLGVNLSEILKVNQKHLDFMFQEEFLNADCIIYDYDSSSSYDQEFIDCFKEISKTLKSIIILKHTDCHIDGIKTVNLSKELNWSSSWTNHSTIYDFMIFSDFHLNTVKQEEFGFIPLEFSIMGKPCFLPDKGAFPEFSNRPNTKIYQNLKDIIPDLILSAKKGKEYRKYLYESSNNRFLKQITEFITKTFKE